MKHLFLILFAALLALPAASSAKNDKGALKVMSYNMRYGTANDGSNSWGNRKEATLAMIEAQRPDVFGVQEAMDFQVEYMLDNCPGYAAVGVGRIDGKAKGEHSSIVYNTAKLTLEDWGNFWLSTTPEAPSFGWDAACERTATWAIFTQKESGKKFFFVNTHLDHRGQVARVRGLQLIMQRMAVLNAEGAPMVLTGDFNINSNDPTILNFDKVMNNARLTAGKTDDFGTFNGWGGADTQIDYIYHKGFGKCTEYETVKTRYAGKPYISDHYPIRALLNF